MSKVIKKKPNEFMKKLNQFSNRMFEKSTGLTAPNTSDYEDEPYVYNSSVVGNTIRKAICVVYKCFSCRFLFYIRLYGRGNYSVYHCLYDVDGIFTATNAKICTTNSFD